ncbi:MAG: hypothetical protein ACI8TE_000930 [Francisella sp.]|jgi:hypothetical protein
MKIINRLSILILIAIGISSCAWYKGPDMMPDADASLDGSSLSESGPNTIDTLESMDDYGGSYADDGGNYDTTNFDNVT